MKAEIHPTYYSDAKVTCVCGNTFTTGSTLKELNIDICSACHPFYTGKQKLVDTEGRVEKFKKKYANFYNKNQSN
ncbi:MAG: 50S ribosomal protein L31 [Bdellovibrionales bacterium]|nr:50S ribosomal protein L31 [Bdellovibrionales bacterium]